MGREKATYRETLSFLIDERGCPLVLNKKQAAKLLGISRNKLYDLIGDGCIKEHSEKIPIGSIANFLCG